MEEAVAHCSMVFVTFCAFLLLMEVLSDKLFGRLMPARFRTFSERNKKILASGFASSLNASIMFSGSFYQITQYGLHENPLWYDCFPVRLLSAFEVGFYLADTVSVLRTDELPGKVSYIFHHAAIIIGSYVTVSFKTYAFFVALRGLNELSVPFQHTRWLLEKMGRKGDLSYLINGLMFLLTFFVSRICIIPILLYMFFSVLGTSQWERLGLFSQIIGLGSTLVIDSLNIYWFRLVAKGAYSTVKVKFMKRNIE